MFAKENQFQSLYNNPSAYQIGGTVGAAGAGVTVAGAGAAGAGAAGAGAAGAGTTATLAGMGPAGWGAIAAMVGMSLLSSQQKKKQAKAQNQMRAAEQRYSPWLGKAQTPYAQSPSSFGAAMKGGVAGLEMVGKMEDREAAKPTREAQAKYLNSRAEYYAKQSGALPDTKPISGTQKMDTNTDPTGNRITPHASEWDMLSPEEQRRRMLGYPQTYNRMG